jgi:hypothetical protein
MSMAYTEQRIKAEAKLAIWEEAEERIAISGQSYVFDDGDMRREVTRADAKFVRSMVVFYTNKIAKLERLENGYTSGNIAHARGV